MIKMNKTTISLMIISLISSVLGFSRNLILAFFYGTSIISDTYIIAMSIPGIVFGLIITGIAAGYIPIYSEIRNKIGEKESINFTNKLVNLLLLLSTVVIIISLTFTELIIKVVASGFDGQTLAMTVDFTRIIIVGIYFYALINIFTAFLQVKGNYIVPALIGFPLNIITILSIYLSSYTNVMVLAIGSVVASAVQFLILVPYIYKEGYQYKLVFSIRDPQIKKMIFLAIPVILGASVNQVNELIDRTIASQLSSGSISALNYASVINGFVQSIFVLSIVTAMFPMISKLAAENNKEGIKKSVIESINTLSLLIIPATIGAMFFAEPIVKLLLGRGSFDEESIKVTSEVLFVYSIGMLGFGMREVLSKAFFAIQDTRTPMNTAIIAVMINIILSLILSRYMGISGVALATSLATTISSLLLLIKFRTKLGRVKMKMILHSSIKILISSLLMGIVTKLIFNILCVTINSNLALIIAIIIGGIIYFIIIYFMKINEVEKIVSYLRIRFLK